VKSHRGHNNKPWSQSLGGKCGAKMIHRNCPTHIPYRLSMAGAWHVQEDRQARQDRLQTDFDRLHWLGVFQPRVSA
jgi:hypothetical protein